jgi:hypothetical protein
MLVFNSVLLSLIVEIFQFSVSINHNIIGFMGLAPKQNITHIDSSATDRVAMSGLSGLCRVAGQVVFVNTCPAAKLGVGLLAIIDRTYSGAQNPGLERAQNGWFIGQNASPEKKTIRPVGQPVVNGEGRRVFGDGRRHERFIKPRQRQTSWCVFLP